MDIKDVSEEKDYVAFFEMIKRKAEAAYRRKGEKVRAHPPPHLLILQYMMKLGNPAGRVGGGLSTSQVPVYYPPCVRPAQQLKPLMISGMTLENHHRGKRALVHVLTPADRLTGVMAIVEDEEGTALLLQLYNQPDEAVVSKDHILKEGDVCLLKEPFFKATVDGQYSLRVDHVSDIIWLQETDTRIPLKWRKRILSLDEGSQDIRLQGNAAVQKRDWAEAEILYTDAIRAAKTAEEEQLAHLNRSLANLHLERSEKALDDAAKGNTSADSPSEKSLFREAKALYALQKFSPCLEKLLELVRSNPKNSDAWAEIKRVKQRVREQETGAYQFSSMYKQAEATPPLIDCATYVGSIAIRDSPGRGKGVFTTKRVKAGELLLCEKAFGYCYVGEDSPIGQEKMTVLINLNSKTMCMGGQANLITQIVQKIYHNHEGAEVFTDLHHGDYAKVATSEVDGSPVVDTFLVAKIIQLNCFGSPRSSFKTVMERTSGAKKDSGSSYTTCGIWPLASRINHSCVTNCRRSFVGDMMLVRACEDLEPGAELFHGYQHLEPNETYAEAQKNLESWGFVCACALCLDRKSTPPETVRERKALCQSLKPVLRVGSSVAQLARAAKILEALEKTYDTGASVPRFEMWDPYFRLGGELVARNKSAEGLEMLLRGLEALGYVIVAYPPRDTGGKNKKKVALEIKRWGQTNEYAVGAFLQMSYAYERLAPELCKVVKRYASVVYSISCGEKDTFGTCFPEFS
ncbi:hypothetical protein F4781DRAFT_220375 [Annulohypoxylon bovei var. microspora]|nr:hypothetical protein F4781DRAFT_220375 [Annulohypoxylon bovei var. microspora]